MCYTTTLWEKTYLLNDIFQIEYVLLFNKAYDFVCIEFSTWNQISLAPMTVENVLWSSRHRISSEKLITNGSGNCLSLLWNQAITWTNANLSFGPSRTNTSHIFKQNVKRFIQQNAFQNVICEITAMIEILLHIAYLSVRSFEQYSEITWVATVILRGRATRELDPG